MATKKPDKTEGETAKSPENDGIPKTKSGTLAKAVSARTAAAKAEPVVLDQPDPAKGEPPRSKGGPPDEPNASKGEPKPSEEGGPEAREPEKQQGIPPRRGLGAGVFAGLVMGGIAAAAIGYFGGGYINPPPAIPDYGAEIREASASHAREIADLRARIAELEAAREDAPLSQLRQEVSDLRAGVDAQSARIAAQLAETVAEIDRKIAELDAARERLTENMSSSGAEISAATAELVARYGAEIENLKAQGKVLSERLDQVAKLAGDQLGDARQKVGELTERIGDAAARVDLTQARARLNAAIASGKSYAEQLAAMATQAAIDIPEALKKDAETGVAPMLELQQRFPDAARDALKASIQAEAGPGAGAKLTAFLKAQLGARSLEEREGDDADAILSRAEAALDRGELRDAIDLVRQLPEQGVAEMSGWLAAAESRLAVQEALTDFNNSLDSNE